ncbi:MAG: DNA repair protein RecN [Rickettsiaceae bacterium]
MLQSLSIQDFILIKRLDLDFVDGFCVITGKTGAGKSILLDAILFAMGNKSTGQIVRSGQEKAIVTLTFSVIDKIILFLSEYDIQLNLDEDLIIKRVQYANGRKKFFINDNIVTQKIVSDLFDHLLEIHGQHNHTSLLNIASHLEILDQSANNISLRNRVSDLYKVWQEICNEVLAINAERENIEKEIDYLSHVCAEFNDLGIKDGEEEKLSEIKKHLQIRDKEVSLVQSILNDLDASKIEQIIARAQRNIGKSEDANLYNQININLEEIYNKTEEMKSALAYILDSFSFSEYSLPEIEDRLYAIKSIARKHACVASDLDSFMQDSQTKLQNLELKLKNSVDLNDKMIKAEQEYFDQANLLSQNRRIAAKELENKTMHELSILDMKKAIFSVEIKSDKKTIRSKGIDEVRFLASTNPGTPKAPIDKIASGGELSRFMLGFRAALFDKESKQTIIFDEVDVGISGSVADVVGQRLKVLSKVAQVIVITHQPQVAGKAEQHILVQKTQTNTDTKIVAEYLDLEKRSRELARMISGKEITINSVAAAKELM